MAMPNTANNKALPKATRRGHTPNIKAIPRTNSAAVAVQARNGMVKAGMKEFTSAVYLTKFAKFP